MFSTIWRFFPGPGWLRVIVMLAVLAAIVYWLLFYGYPWAAQLLEGGQTISTVEDGT